MAFKDARAEHAADVETAAVIQRYERVKALIDRHIDDYLTALPIVQWRLTLLQAVSHATLPCPWH
jgi:hypothetical protein